MNTMFTKIIAAAAIALGLGGAAQAATLSNLSISGFGTVELNRNVITVQWTRTNPNFNTEFDLTVPFTRRLLLTKYDDRTTKTPSTATTFFSVIGRDLTFNGRASEFLMAAGTPRQTTAPISVIGDITGTVTFTIQENLDPRSAKMQFELAPIPLPAGGVLLLAGLGGLAMLRRRAKA